MHRSPCILLFIVLLQACVSGSKYRAAQGEIDRLKADSVLLAKRNRMLGEEKLYLENKSATMEQTLNQRLQEKQDSLNQKETLLQQRELSINDMKTRKAEEREAFNSLAASVSALFSEYGTGEVSSYTSCTQIHVEVSERLLFLPNTTKPDPQSAKILSKVATALGKNPDLNLLITAHTDSVAGVKEKYEDNWSLGSMKANALVRAMIREQKIAPSRIASGSRGDTVPLRKGSTGIGRNRIDFIFYSEFLPCIHSKE